MSRSAFYVGFRMQPFKETDDLDGAMAAYEEVCEANPDIEWLDLEQSAILSHWRHRSHVPLAITDPLSREEAEAIASFVEGHPRLGFETRFVREYPMGGMHGAYQRLCTKHAANAAWSPDGTRRNVSSDGGGRSL